MGPGTIEMATITCARCADPESLHAFGGPCAAAGCTCGVLLEAGECPDCDGTGEARHPAYGASWCPEPTVACGACAGTGEVAA